MVSLLLIFFAFLCSYFYKKADLNLVPVLSNLSIPYFLSYFIFVFLSMLFLIYVLFEKYSVFYFFTDSNSIILYNSQIQPFYSLNPFSLNLLTIYVFPFIYVFATITLISVIFALTYNFAEFYSFLFFILIITFAGFGLFVTDSFALFFFFYELLLIPSFFILYKFGKTRRSIEASYSMFFWTQFGALFLIFTFTYLTLRTGTYNFSSLDKYFFSYFEINFLFLCLLFGFGVKIPIWPFYGWLPKAHVEASTNFSIFLSGVLVKFAFFGFLKCLIALQTEPSFIFAYPLLVVGIVDTVPKLFFQRDLKKLIAYSTVLEMHWLTICVISGHSPLILASFAMLISHAFISTLSFLLVDSITRRFKTREITEISGLNYLCPKLFLICLINCQIFLGFPGSIYFISEVLFYTFFFDINPITGCILLFLMYLLAPSFFYKSWLNVMFGFSSFNLLYSQKDLNSREFLLYVFLCFIVYWLGFTWQSFII